MSARSGSRYGAVAGLACVVLFVVTFLLVGDTGSTAAETAKKLPAHRHQLTAACVTATLSMVAALVFFSWLSELVRTAAPGRASLARLSLAAAAAMAALVPGSLAILAGAGNAGHDAGSLSPAVAAFANDAQFPFLGLGMTFGGVALICAMLALRGTSALPGWLVTSGLVVGVLGLASLAFFPLLLFFVWLLVASIVLLARKA
jgi:hypothetical protein